MESILKPLIFPTSPIVLLILISIFLPLVSSNSDYSSLVYSKCANQTYTAASTESHSQVLSSLFQDLLAQSSHSKFYRTTSGDEQIGISGLFQCRGDLGSDDCYNCVSTLPEMSTSKCKQAVAARVQLNGCYFHYETDGFLDETPKHELLHESCSEKKAVDSSFVEVRDAAFLVMESEGVSEKGFYEADYEHVRVAAQCEGDLGGCDCSECVRFAMEIAQEDCGSSVSGKVYLDSCFVSYSNNPDGTPGKSYPDEEGKKRDKTGKTIAIVLGGAASLFAGFMVLKIIKSRGKKDEI
eukprot:XP_015576529.1 cysteine-rich repeat secretory protein 3 [Ricinus communis]